MTWSNGPTVITKCNAIYKYLCIKVFIGGPLEFYREWCLKNKIKINPRKLE